MKSVCGAEDAAALGERLLAVGGERPRQLEQRLTEALAEEPAVGLREQGLADLTGALRRVAGERVEPDVEAVLDVGDVAAEHQGANREQHQPGQHV